MGHETNDGRLASATGPPGGDQRSGALQDGAAEARWSDDGGHDPGPAAAPPGRDQGSLFLRGVLESALPHELGTNDEPPWYTVAATFSRQVSPEERELIEATEALARLAASGYPDVRLTVADRRLEISHTNLATLAGGLAAEIADLLRDVERQVVTARRLRDDERLRWSEAEAARAARVKAEADGVRFE